jgi:hypothetical protein
VVEGIPSFGVIWGEARIERWRQDSSMNTAWYPESYYLLSVDMSLPSRGKSSLLEYPVQTAIAAFTRNGSGGVDG